MEWFVVVLVVAVIGVAAVAAAGRLGQLNAEPIRDLYRQDLPDRPLVTDDIESVRFAVTFRGYAMAQVDDLLERLGHEIAERDRRIAELTRPGEPQPEPVIERRPEPVRQAQENPAEGPALDQPR